MAGMASPPLAALKQQWQAGAARFAALQQREKVMVISAILVGVLVGGYTLWIEPAELQAASLIKTLEQQQADMAQLSANLVILAKKSGDPDAPNRAALAEVQKQLDETEREIAGFDKLLLAPAQAPALLQALLGKHRGLSLVSLTTLPPQPLIGTAAKSDARPVPTGNIFKHGIEIRMTGSYHDLLSYVNELENAPQKLLWGAMTLVVQKYPVSELTLTIYTLSLEPAWLVV